MHYWYQHKTIPIFTYYPGLIARDHLSYLFLQPVHSYAATVGPSYNNHHNQNHNHGRGGESLGSLYDYSYQDQEDYYYQPYNEEEFVYSYQWYQDVKILENAQIPLLNLMF